VFVYSKKRYFSLIKSFFFLSLTTPIFQEKQFQVGYKEIRTYCFYFYFWNKLYQKKKSLTKRNQRRDSFYDVTDSRTRDDNGAGRGRVSLFHTYLCKKKKSSTSPYPNPTGIKLLSHPHSHRVTGIILYPYPYPFSYYFNINFE